MNERGQILIVDDEPDIAHFLHEMLRDHSYSTESACNGNEALSFLKRCPTDIMITDIRMPGMDGLELMKQARWSQPDLSCMVITGHGDMDTAVQAIKLGAVDFFTKPLDFTKLEKAVGAEINRLWLMREIRQQQRELAASNQKLAKEICKNQVILHAAGQGIIGLDGQGEITFINPAAMEILGWERNELIACSFAELVGEDNAKDILSLSAPPIDGRRLFCQTFFKRKDRSIFPVEYVKSLIADDNNKGSVLVFEDITERQAQREKLAQAKIEAEEANLAKSHFLARMSHEIRTPMNSILGISELLMADKLSKRQKKLCETMLQSGSTLLQLINDVLDVSKIESGKLELTQEDFDLEQLIEHSLEIVAGGANKKGLGLAYRIEAEVDRFLSGDSHKLKQVLVNLLANAVKFTEQGEVTVRVRCLETYPDRNMLYFEIQDTGIGIPKEAQEHIFDPFTQVDVSTSNRFGGTGLGLTIVQHLAAMMGGDVGLSSTLGNGATFWFTALLSRQQKKETETQMNRRESLMGLRVLIVDPYPLSSQFLQEQLQEWQVDSESTELDTEGLRLLLQASKENRPYDVVLLDTRANTTGIERDNIIFDEEITETPLFLLTGINDNAQNAVTIPWPARNTEELTKPLYMDELYNSLLLLQHPDKTKYPVSTQKITEYGPSPCCFDARILLVDDNITNQLVVSEMLALVGCRPDIASDGHEAVTILARDDYDLILMDCQMPEMDGFEATAYIRKKEREVEANKHTPIIAMTAKALQGDRRICLAAGMDDYLSKPFSREELHQMLQIWLPGKSTGNGKCPDLDKEEREMPREKKDTPLRVDESMLARLRALQEASNTNLLKDLFAYFADDAPRTMEFLRQAIERQDWESMKDEAHRFKSSCANLGANIMVLLCHRLQKFDDCSEEKAVEILQSLQQEYQAVKDILDKEAMALT